MIVCHSPVTTWVRCSTVNSGQPPCQFNDTVPASKMLEIICSGATADASVTVNTTSLPVPPS